MKDILCNIQPINKETGEKVKKYLDTLTKPPGSLGRLEDLVVQLAEITSESFPVVTPPGVIVFAADHGVVDEGVSAFPQEVTAQMVANFLQGGAAINVFSKQIGAYFEIVDVGVVSDLDSHGVINRKIRYGTANFCKEDAMTREEAEEAIKVGYEQAEKMMKDKGIKCLILGEMGIGNTTASSAILSILSGKSIEKLVGHGTGISNEQVLHKQKIILQGIEARKPDRNDPIDVLAKVGGLEIAAMTGAMLAAAAHNIPILVDGFICSVAAVLATKLCSNTKGYMIIGHRSVENGHQVAIQLLEKQPILDLGLRLGEGSGAAVAFPILQSATLMLKNMATFTSAGVTNKE